MKKLVVIGNGMAGMRCVEEILKRDAETFKITVFGNEPYGNYNRIMLSPVLSGEKTFDEIMINSTEWYEENGITLHTNAEVIEIDRENKVVKSANGIEESYDKLLIATGSSPFIIPVPGKDLEGVITFRDMKDVETMDDAISKYKNAVVIGGGLLGLEAAYGLQRRGMKATVIHLMDTLMERQLDEAAGHLLKKELEGRDIDVLTGANTKEIVGKDGRVSKVVLEDGRQIDADLVVMAVGIRPNTTLAASADLDVERGIMVNDQLVTSDADIYSVGECVQHRGSCYGLVAPLYEMGKALADHITGKEDSAYEGSVTSTKLKVSGVDVFSAGDFSGGEDCEDIVLRDAARGVYKRVVLKDNKIQGAVLYGDTADGAWYFSLLKEAADVSEMRDLLIFGQAFASGGGAAQDPIEAVAALPADAEICGCNGVCKGDIVTAINENGLTSLDEVKAHTKASASCGTCANLVENVIKATIGDAYSEVSVKPMCGCTEHTHDDVRAAIIDQELKSIHDVYQALEWKTPNGCSSCRPAMNYYLLCAWPGEYVDDAQSRFINERAHANIQKDGTYSVVPRMWGGLTNPKELRAIADVAEKFDVKTVKVTGGQRIDLFGIKKEDLPSVWADLNAAGMVSGHAYGKSLRTVKTCVGKEWCRFGTQMSMDMGVKLEKMAWGSYMPHKFKMAVSGCPRNCAEATIKDFGVICVDSGYQLSVAGNGGIHVRANDDLCLVKTEEEVLEYAGAYIQLYRQEARYLERTAPWVERVGLDYVKSIIVDDEARRKELYERFIFSQSFWQDDPWAKAVNEEEAGQEFKPLAVMAAE
ncbi:nitrite reductase large subunit NirB [Terasakiella sp. A23]|uniref:nitrite reductase large subunit NirB n=1 Tax=Terasakiella sp. FCG-A23 TaxID=3080561 RepID=UPI00295355F2|nr:nitrite reductase large subunit NirB [Terasakiella sp. A23]MDV7341097.1 nitrite reductase large subunit NirB [Terasakiella sp. A23]